MIKQKLLLLLLTLFFINCNNTDIVTGTLPSIKKVGKFSVEILYHTNKPHIGKLSYNAINGEKYKLKDTVLSLEHKFNIGGLLPGKKYFYNIDTHRKEFSFRTLPNSTTAFRFAVISKESSTISDLSALLPDFIICSGDKKQYSAHNKFLEELNTKIPIFYSPFDFKWGNSRFVESKAQIIKGENIFIIKSDTLHYKYKYKNKNLKSLGLKSKALCIEVQGPDVMAAYLDSALLGIFNLTLNSADLNYKKTCVYCRRLLEDKKYLQSIKWYKKFIKTNKNKKLNDDAKYQIAYIYDHYLFDYENALKEYCEFIKEYPKSRMNKISKFRLAYINKHNDYKYIPLKTFEKARLTRFSEDGVKAINSVDSIVKLYANNSLKDEMLLWLASMSTPFNSLDAILYLNKIEKNTNNNNQYFKAQQTIADIYYANKKYNKAKEIYIKLQIENTSLKFELNSKIMRCSRNNIRQNIFILSIFVLIFLFLATFFLKPIGLELKNLYSLILYGALFFILSIMPIVIWYENLANTIVFTLVFTSGLIVTVFILNEFLNKLRKFILSSIGINILRTTILLITIFAYIFIMLYKFHYIFIFEGIL